jgi:hypothetical protein
MTISAVVNRASFTGNGSTTGFAFPYPFHAQADLVVISTVIATGVQTTKALTTHYTISGTPDAQGHYPDGGTVDFITAPAATESITIYRDPALIQSVNLTENDSLPVESAVESPFDYLTMICQRLSDRLSRALRQPEGDTANIDLLPAKVTRASKYLAFDADGDPIASSATDGVVASTFMETVLDDTTAALARTTLDAQQATESLPALTLPVSGDSLPLYDVSGSSSSQITLDDLLKFLHTSKVCEGRLTLTTGVPVTTADVLAAETLYFAPYKGHKIALYDGTSWVLRTFTEVSIDVPDATNVYDVFAYDNAGVVTLELTAWTNTTTRATALTTQDGVLVKTGVLTRRYLGSFYCTTAGNGQTEDSKAKRYVWNYYNRVVRDMKVTEATDNWNYSTATWRQANGSGANQLDFVIGVSEDSVRAVVGGARSTSSGATARIVRIGIGLDSTTAFSGLPSTTSVSSAAIDGVPPAFFEAPIAVGKHVLTWLEQGGGTDTQTWYGDAGSPLDVQSGIMGVLWG